MARSQLQTLTEPMYYILLSLTSERYGYQIMQVVTEKTKERVTIGPGTLYTILARFVDEGIIRQVREVERRKVYIITDYGMELLEKEYTRLNQLILDGKHILGDGEEEIIQVDLVEEEEEIIEDEEIVAQEEAVFRKPSDDSIFF